MTTSLKELKEERHVCNGKDCDGSCELNKTPQENKDLKKAEEIVKKAKEAIGSHLCRDNSCNCDSIQEAINKLPKAIAQALEVKEREVVDGCLAVRPDASYFDCRDAEIASLDSWEKAIKDKYPNRE